MQQLEALEVRTLHGWMACMVGMSDFGGLLVAVNE